MNRAELARRQRCRALELAIVLGVLLAVFGRTWITVSVGLGGAAVAFATYRRNCRGADES